MEKVTEASPRLVVGIDLGSADSYVAFLSKGVVDVVQNEVSQRRTPTLVGFTDRERLLGDQALSQIKSNTKNTCRNFKHLLAQKIDSPNTEEEKFWSTCPLVEDDRGFAGFSVNYRGEQKVFAAEAVAAMFLTKLKCITEAWGNGVLEDAVVGVPSYFSAFQRTALLDAAKVAGVNVLRIMNDHTATALEYGYFRSNSFDAEKPQTVAFCNMGHVVFSVAIVQFVRGRLTILSERSAKVGGRNMDECLIRTFAEQFKKKTGCELLTNKKALFKLEDAVSKTKKILSANSEATVSCECLMEDEDFSSRIDRADFLEMCKPMMAKVSEVLEAAKAAAGLPPSAVDTVEMCGGASRVPWVKEMCSKAFGGKELSTTMNADECVARGCLVQAALLSPLYKTREFKVEDTCPLPVSLGWRFPGAAREGAAAAGGDARSKVIFPKNSLMNMTKVMTFLRKEPFELSASYGGESGEALPEGLPKSLGAYRVELPAQAEKKRVKVRASLTLHGTFELTQAQLLEDEGPEAGGNEPAAGSPRSENGKVAEQEKEGSEGATKRPAEGAAGGQKRRLRRTELQITSIGSVCLSEEKLQQRRATEAQMVAETKEIEETNARRNDLESYILTTRSHIEKGGKLGEYITEAERTAFKAQLSKAEDWLYDHPDDPKQVVMDKLAELKVAGGPVELRHREQEKRPEAVSGLERAAKQLQAATQAVSGKPQFDVAQLRSLEQACEEALRWLKALQGRQERLARHEDPVLTSSTILQRKQELVKLADTALGRKEEGADARECALPPPTPAPAEGPITEDEVAASPRPMDVD